MIFTGFQPNATKKDISLALKYLCLPWYWKNLIKGEYTAKAERLIRKHFSVPHTYLFDSGRSALEIGLRALGVGPGDEVIIQAYTCVVVVNAIKWIGATPVFADIQTDFTLDPQDVQRKITELTKVIIVQHTFGIPADMRALTAIAKEHHLYVLEDAAHSLGSTYEGQLLGTIGDIGMLSFGTDKALSSARGGALITLDDAMAERIDGVYKEITYPKIHWILPYLMNYPFFAAGKAFYRIYIGKIFLMLMKKLRISGRVIYEREKKGIRSHFSPSLLPNSLAHILSLQLEDLDDSDAHREKVSQWYTNEIDTPYITKPALPKGTIAVRYPILTTYPQELHAYFKKNGILLGEWYDTVIAPNDTKMDGTHYVPGSCPVAEKLASQSVNLPTSRHISLAHADRIAKLINAWKPTLSP